MLLKRREHQRRYDRFLERLRQARANAGLRQEDVRVKIGTYQTYMSKVESGERRLDIIELQQLADVYERMQKEGGGLRSFCLPDRGTTSIGF